MSENNKDASHKFANLLVSTLADVELDKFKHRTEATNQSERAV